MLEQLKVAYTVHQWVRIVAGLGLLICGVLLYRISGGFPPWAWRFLAQVVPRLPRLWALQGPAVLLPFTALVLLSLTLLLAWGLVVRAIVIVVRNWWLDWRERQRFAMEMQAALAAATSEIQRMAGAAQQDTEEVEPPPIEPVHSGTVRSAIALPKANAPASWSASGQEAESTARPLPVPRRAHASEEQTTPISRTLRIIPPRETSEMPASDEEQDPRESSIRLAVGASSDPGIKRRDDPNEDSVLAIQGMCHNRTDLLPFGLFVVADGMGGHANGREASRLAIKTISDVVMPAVLRSAEGEEIFTEILSEGVHRANLALYQHNRQQSEDQFMGTTLNAALVAGTTACVVNVGDSRTYLYRKGDGLSQITRDHSVVARLVEEQAIRPEDVYTHPRRNEIYRCLGEHASVKVDSFTVPLQVSDCLLLCSDGLWEMVRDPDIEQILQSSRPHASQATALLTRAALNRGGVDNVSVIVAYVTQSYL